MATTAVADPTAQRTALEAERRQLAPAAVAGDADAKQRVRAIADELARLADDAQLVDLAGAETARLAAEERQQREAAHRAQLEARLAELTAAFPGQLDEAAARIRTVVLAEFQQLRPVCIEKDAIATELSGQVPVMPALGVAQGTLIQAFQWTIADFALGGA